MKNNNKAYINKKATEYFYYYYGGRNFGRLRKWLMIKMIAIQMKQQLKKRSNVV